MCTQHGGFLNEVDRFDGRSSGFHRGKQRLWTPARLVLEVAWEAWRMQAIARPICAGAHGVFLGIGNSDYGRHAFADLEQIDAYTGSGNSPAYGGRAPFLRSRIARSVSRNRYLVLLVIGYRSRRLLELRAGECSVALAAAST